MWQNAKDHLTQKHHESLNDVHSAMSAAFQKAWAAAAAAAEAPSTSSMPQLSASEMQSAAFRRFENTWQLQQARMDKRIRELN